MSILDDFRSRYGAIEKRGARHATAEKARGMTSTVHMSTGGKVEHKAEGQRIGPVGYAYGGGTPGGTPSHLPSHKKGMRVGRAKCRSK